MQQACENFTVWGGSPKIAVSFGRIVAPIFVTRILAAKTRKAESRNDVAGISIAALEHRKTAGTIFEVGQLFA